jgi:hypothetical protein
MPSSATTYPDWKAPAEDGQTLVWPEPDQIVAQTRENQRRLSSASKVTLQNVPLPELRRRQREWVGHDDAKALIASGHQTELYHAGVWAKDALGHAAAQALNGEMYHLAVETDAPKHLNLKWPGASLPITDDPGLATAQWCELLHPPTPAHVQSLDRELAEASHGWNFEPLAGDFLASMRRLALESTNLSAALTNATHELDWSLGLRHHALVMAPVLSSDPFLVFAHHVIARARAFATAYNNALAEYRRDNKVNTASRPMPDVAVDDDSVEVPFWLDDLRDGTRARPTVLSAPAGWLLRLPGGDDFLFEPSAGGWDAAARLGQWLRGHSMRISPRALTLTLFLRLTLVDQFIHGIGGGRYDQVTDRLIADHFGLEPPSFCVTTATLYFPEAVGRSRVCLPCVAQEGHKLRHNVLGPRKRELVERIAAAPRKSVERTSAYYDMHRQLSAAGREHPLLSRWDEHVRQVQQRELEEAAVFDRELFYAIQPRDRLGRLLEHYNAAFA